MQSTSTLIGINFPATEKFDIAQPYSQKMFADDWARPEWQCTLTRMMEVWEEKQRLENCLGDPSFSLGFSQDPNFNSVVSSPCAMYFKLKQGNIKFFLA